jgi:hypothetical protein
MLLDPSRLVNAGPAKLSVAAIGREELIENSLTQSIPETTRKLSAPLGSIDPRPKSARLHGRKRRGRRWLRIVTRSVRVWQVYGGKKKMQIKIARTRSADAQ